VSSVVVHDEVNVQFFGHVLLDGVEEVAELLGAMALLVLADDLAGPGVQRGKARQMRLMAVWLMPVACAMVQPCQGFYTKQVFQSAGFDRCVISVFASRPWRKILNSVVVAGL
jgi:hypothetical protein